LEQLEAPRPPEGVPAPFQPVVIRGLGGVGKTRLALEYAWRHQHEFSALLFVPALTADDLASNLALLCSPEALALPEYQLPAKEDQRGAVIRWLKTHDDWLLVFDNVDTLEAVAAVRELMPGLSRGRVLITSRIAEWSDSVRQVPLEVIPVEAAAAYLLEATRDQQGCGPDEPGQGRALAERLGCLPLALTHAAAYARQSRIGLRGYLAVLETNPTSLIDYHNHFLIDYEPHPERTGMVKTVATTFLLSFEHLGPVAKAILRVASLLAPEPVPFRIFDADSDELGRLAKLWRQETGEQGTLRPFPEALEDLARYSLITRSEASFAIHRMEQLVLQCRIPASRKPAWIRQAARLLIPSLPEEGENPQTWRAWEKLRPHAEALVAIMSAETGVTPDPELLYRLGTFLLAKAVYGKAGELLTAALAAEEKQLGPDHPNVARDLVALARLLRETKRLPEAAAAARRALRIDETASPSSPAAIARDLNECGEILFLTPDFRARVPFYRRALQLRKSHFGLEHFAVAESLNNLASALQDCHLLRQAEALYLKSLEVGRRVLRAPNHLRLGAWTNNYACLLLTTGRYQQAEAAYRTALHIFETCDVPDHPDMIGVLDNLAPLAPAEESLVLRERALAIRERRFPAHPETLVKGLELALAHQARGSLALAEAIYRRLLDPLPGTSAPGPEDRVALVLRIQFASLLEQRQEFGEAERQYRAALAALKREKDPDGLLGVWNSLATLLQKTGQWDAAEWEFRQALRRGPNHTVLLGNFACFLLNVRRHFASAEEHFLSALALDPEDSVNQANYAALLILTRRLEEARRHLAKASESSDRRPEYASRVVFLQAALAALQRQPFKSTLGRLKALLDSPPAQSPWAPVALMTGLRERLPPGTFDLFATALAALNQPQRHL
jgi:tetratricopeptide (TPR) repeat protein